MSIIRLTVPENWRGRLRYMGKNEHEKVISLGYESHTGKTTTVDHLIYTYEGDVTITASGAVGAKPFHDHEPVVVTIPVNATREQVVAGTLGAVKAPVNPEDGATSGGGTGDVTTAQLNTALNTKQDKFAAGTNGQFVKADGSGGFAPAWIAFGDIYQGQASLDAKIDKPANPANGQVLTWDGSAWAAQTPASGGGTAELTGSNVKAIHYGDATDKLMAHCAQGEGFMRVAILHDSWGHGRGRSIHALCKGLAAEYPGMLVRYTGIDANTTTPGWRTDSDANFGQDVMNAGVANASDTSYQLLDIAAIGSGDLHNQNLTGPGGGQFKSTGATFTIDASGAHPEGASGSKIGFNSFQLNNRAYKVRLNVVSTGTGTAQKLILCATGDSIYFNSYLGASLDVSSTGAVTCQLLANSNITPLPTTPMTIPDVVDNSATAQDIDVTVTTNNGVLSLKAQKVGSATAAEKSVQVADEHWQNLGGTTGFRTFAVTPGIAIKRVEMLTPQGLIPHELDVRCIGWSGERLDHQVAPSGSSRLENVLPPVDRSDVTHRPVGALIVQHGLNYQQAGFGATSGVRFKRDLDDLHTILNNASPTSAAHTSYGTGVMVVGQGLPHTGSGYYASQKARIPLVRGYARDKSWSYIPAFEYTLKDPAGHNATFNAGSDTLHPIVTISDPLDTSGYGRYTRIILKYLGTAETY